MNPPVRSVLLNKGAEWSAEEWEIVVRYLLETHQEMLIAYASKRLTTEVVEAHASREDAEDVVAQALTTLDGKPELYRAPEPGCPEIGIPCAEPDVLPLLRCIIRKVARNKARAIERRACESSLGAVWEPVEYGKQTPEVLVLGQFHCTGFFQQARALAIRLRGKRSDTSFLQ